MIGLSRNPIPLLQQLKRLLTLPPDNRRRVRPQRNTHRHLLSTRHRQNIDQYLAPLNNITRLVLINLIQYLPNLTHGTLVVLLNALLALDLRVGTQKAGAEVAGLDDSDRDAERCELGAHALGYAADGPFGAGVEGITWATGPGADGAEVCDGAVAGGGAHVGQEGFGDVEGAEDVGVECGVVFCGAGGVSARWLIDWLIEEGVYEVSSTAPTRMYPAALTRCVM
jgi:hypothetical protein